MAETSDTKVGVSYIELSRSISDQEMMAVQVILVSDWSIECNECLTLIGPGAVQ